MTGIIGITGLEWTHWNEYANQAPAYMKSRHVTLLSRLYSNLPVTVRTKFTLSHRVRLQGNNQSGNRDKNVLSLDVWLKEKHSKQS